MSWTNVFRDIIQPILFFGLFGMTLVGMLLGVRAERRERLRKKRRIFHPETERFHGLKGVEPHKQSRTREDNLHPLSRWW
jgi:hypothetical protein